MSFEATSFERERPSRPRGQLTREQQGLIFAALTAFLGVSYIGPAIAALRERARLRHIYRAHIRETRRMVAEARRKLPRPAR